MSFPARCCTDSENKWLLKARQREREAGGRGTGEALGRGEEKKKKEIKIIEKVGCPLLQRNWHVHTFWKKLCKEIGPQRGESRKENRRSEKLNSFIFKILQYH